MTGEGSEERASAYEPGSMPASSLVRRKAVWYRRPWFLIVLTVAVLVAVSVAADLPHHLTTAQDAADQNATIALINTDIAACSYALTESYGFYNDWRHGSLTSAQSQQVPPLLAQDQTSCTLASGPLYDLSNNIQPVDTAAGRKIDTAYQEVIRWATNDAKDAVTDIISAITQPAHRAAAQRDLLRRDAYLRADRVRVEQLVAAAAAILHRPLTPLHLPKLPRLATS